MGDEEEVLPIKLQNEILTSLNRHNNNNNVHSKDNSFIYGKTDASCLSQMASLLREVVSLKRPGLGCFCPNLQ